MQFPCHNGVGKQSPLSPEGAPHGFVRVSRYGHARAARSSNDVNGFVEIMHAFLMNAARCNAEIKRKGNPPQLQPEFPVFFSKFSENMCHEPTREAESNSAATQAWRFSEAK